MTLMKKLLALTVSGVMVTACSSESDTRLLGVADLPLKSTTLPSFSIEQAPLRANARYITYDARTSKESKLRVGDYYYVRWYDAHPEEPVRLVMHYTQAATGATKLRRELQLDTPRKRADVMLTPFFYTGEDRAKKGDVMTWKVELYSGGKLKDTRCSYLWRDTPKTPVVPKPAESVEPTAPAASDGAPKAAVAPAAPAASPEEGAPAAVES